LPRVIASARELHGTSEKEGGRGLRPCKDQELGFGCSHVAVVAEVGRRRLVSNTLGKRAPKRAAGSSERRPSFSRLSVGETAGSFGERKDEDRRIGLTRKRVRIGPRLRVARDRHPAVAPSPKAVRWSRDRGCNGHRILGRVPADGRHLGPRCGAGFHESAMAVVSAVSGFSDESREGEATVGKAEIATGVSEARSHRCRGQKTPTFDAPGREAVEVEVTHANGGPPKRSFGRRETSGPPVVVAWSLSLHGTSPPRKRRERTGNKRGAGARSSNGWQMSVRRIARLLHREVARPVGGTRGR